MDIDNSLLVPLQNLITESQLKVSEQQTEQLVLFVQMMHKWNKAYNLTSIRDPQDMLIKHILDSIIIAPHLDGNCYIDVGTGPGLPGIPLAIMHPEKQFVLLDSLGKRVRFMKQVSFDLGIENIQPVQSRVEQFESELQFDGVLSRAFASLKDMLHWCQHLVDSQGKFLALKGQYPTQEIEEMPSGFALTNTIELDIPSLEGKRHLLTITKQ